MFLSPASGRKRETCIESIKRWGYTGMISAIEGERKTFAIDFLRGDEYVCWCGIIGVCVNGVR